MSITITNRQYALAKIYKDYAEYANQEITISDEEAMELGLIEPGEPDKQAIHTITFKDGDEIIRTITGPMGTYVSVPGGLTKEGYTFDGWSLNGEHITMPIDGIYDSDITYYAVWSKIESGEQTGESEHEEEHDYSKDYLTFEAVEDCKFGFNSKVNSIYYSINNGNSWNILHENEETPLITTGNKILWKCQNPLMDNYYGGIGNLGSNGKFNIEGNIMSLINGDNFIDKIKISKNQFSGLFFRNTNLISAKNLIIPDGCMANGAFNQMFSECINLIDAPILYNKYVSSGCYDYMFVNCNKLKYIKCLVIGYYNYDVLNNFDNNKMFDSEYGLNWLAGVSSSGTFVKYKNSTFERGVSGIPHNWLLERIEE